MYVKIRPKCVYNVNLYYGAYCMCYGTIANPYLMDKNSKSFIMLSECDPTSDNIFNETKLFGDIRHASTYLAFSKVPVSCK